MMDQVGQVVQMVPDLSPPCMVPRFSQIPRSHLYHLYHLYRIVTQSFEG
jgi:hypothetical protein